MKEEPMTVPARPSPIPDSYRRVTPCLTVHGAAKALEFYAAVFGATERMRFPGPDGTIAHAEIQIGDSVVIVDDEDPRRGTKAPPRRGTRGDGAASGGGPVLRRPRRPHHRPVRARVDRRVACGRRGAGGDDAA